MLKTILIKFGIDADVKKLTNVNKAFDDLRIRAVNLLSPTTLLAGGIAGIGYAAVKTIQTFSKLETKMQSTGTMAGLNKKEIAGLTQEIIDLSKKAPQSLDDLAQGYYDLISSGVKVSDSMDVMKEASDLATAGVTSLATSIDGMTSVMNAFSTGASEATHITDLFYNAQKFGKVTIEQISQQIGRVAPLAAQAGVLLDELFAAIGSATQTIRPELAMTGLNQALSNIVKPSAQAIKLAEKLGIEFSGAALKAKGLGGFLADLKLKTGNSTEALSLLFGSVEALNSVLAVSRNDMKEFNRVLDAGTKAAGVNAKAVSEQMETIGYKWGLLKNRVIATSNDIVLANKDSINAILDLARSAFNSLSLIIEKYEELEKIKKENEKKINLEPKSFANSIVNRIFPVSESVKKSNINAAWKYTGMQDFGKQPDISYGVSAPGANIYNGVISHDMPEIEKTKNQIGQEKYYHDLATYYANLLSSGSKIDSGSKQKSSKSVSTNEPNKSGIQSDWLLSEQAKGNEISLKMQKDHLEKILQTEKLSASDRESLTRDLLRLKIDVMEDEKKSFSMQGPGMVGIEKERIDAILESRKDSEQKIELMGTGEINFLQEQADAKLEIENETNRKILESRQASIDAGISAFEAEWEKNKSVLDSSKAYFKGILISQLEMKIRSYQNEMSAFAAANFWNPTGWAAMAGIAGLEVIFQSARSQILAMAAGGIVPGTNFSGGDTVPIMATPGELILNAAHQKQLAKNILQLSAGNLKSEITTKTDNRVLSELSKLNRSMAEPKQILLKIDGANSLIKAVHSGTKQMLRSGQLSGKV